MTYEAGDNVIFYYTKAPVAGAVAAYYDTTQMNFGRRFTTVQDSAVFSVNLMGNISGEKRPFIMEADPDSSTAIAGVHYQLPPADSLYMPAGQTKQRIVVKVFRPAGLRDTTAILYLRLKPNTFFQTNRPVYSYNATREMKATSFQVILDDRLLKPTIWDASVNALGIYTREKLELMVKQQNLDVNKFYAASFYTATQLTSFSKTMQTYLNTQKSQGKTVYEKDGTEMKMGPAAQ